MFLSIWDVIPFTCGTKYFPPSLKSIEIRIRKEFGCKRGREAMKKGKITGVLSIAVAVLLQAGAGAHDPIRLELRFVPEQGKLGVKVTHRSAELEEHHIARVEIAVGNRGKWFRYDSQPSENGLIKWYGIRADFGETVTVTAHCNRGGSIQAALEVGSEIGVTVGEPPRVASWGITESEREPPEKDDAETVSDQPARENNREYWNQRPDSYDLWIQDYYRRPWRRYYRPEHHIFIHHKRDHDDHKGNDRGSGEKDGKNRPVWDPSSINK